jgi:hypothetical protein
MIINIFYVQVLVIFIYVFGYNYIYIYIYIYCPVPKHPAHVICCIPEAVPEARVTSFSFIMGVVHFIPSARLMGGVGWGLDFSN